jgi:hypothetical protein
MQPVRLCLEPPRDEGRTLLLAGVLQHPDGPRQAFWWRLPTEWRQAVTLWADPFVVAFLFPMMQWRRDVMVEGAVSPSLLSNLEHYMAIWHAWMPGRYQPVDIRASEEVEPPPPVEEGHTIVPFSCGVDSSFTLYRHRNGLAGRRTRRITAAMVMHGFDIQLDQENAQGMYAGLLEGARAMLDSMGVACIPVASNFREMQMTWADSHGTHLISGLQLLAGQFDSALVPNSNPYVRLLTGRGSHPVSDPRLGSRHFQVVDDGAEAVRFEKIRVIADWPEAMRHLRVCVGNHGSHVNCCRCEKCLRTMLSFRAAGVELPPAFSRDVSNREIRRTHFYHDYNVLQWRDIIQGADQRGLGRSGWVRAIHAVIRRNQRRWKWRWLKEPFVPLRNRIRTVFRGSPLSRRELAQLCAKPQPPSSRS